ncbi:MAG: thioredoxin domain-containing protein [Thermodesulfobacteriota bacterium]
MEATSPLIIRCAGCGAGNKIPPEKAGRPAKCGKCGAALKIDGPGAAAAEVFMIRCGQCKAKNRVPAEKIRAGAKCGKCGAALPAEDLFAGEALMITDSNFETKVINSPLPVLLFAWAPWCPSCRTFTPVIDSYASVARGKVRVGKLNVDANPGLSSKYNILSVPFVFIFDNGQLKESMPGAMQQHELMMKMAHYL